MVPSCDTFTRCPGHHHSTRPVWLQLVQQLRVCNIARQQRRSKCQDCRCSKDRQRRLQASRCLAAAAAAASAADVETDPGVPSTSGTMEMELQGRSYRIIQLEGCEYLIATDEAGRLDLRDAYVHDLETDIFARPESSGVMPDVPSMYSEVPWRVRFTGDRVYGKQPWQRVEKVYLVEQRPPSDKVHFWLNLDQVWVLDSSSKRLDRAPVLWNEHITDDTDHTKLILRIRKDGLFMDILEDMLHPEELVIEAELAAFEEEKVGIRKKMASSMSTVLGTKESAADRVGSTQLADEGQPQDPIDAMSDNDFDGPEDTPAVDLGF